MQNMLKVAIVGLDTSHTIEFTRLIQGGAPGDAKIEGLRVVAAMRFPSPFQAEKDQDGRQAQLEKWGVKVSRSLDEAVAGADALMLEINDPALHLQYFQQAAELGKPVFLDKPLAGTLKDGQAICELAAKKKIKVWGASSLRFADGLAAARAQTPKPVLCNVYGPMGKAPAGSSLVWYGCHTFEMAGTIMGRGARSVLARKDANGVAALISYADGRRAIAECIEKAWFYGGRIQSAEKAAPFTCATDMLYYNILLRVRDFFHWGANPVPLEDSLEILAMLDAAERSVASGKEENLNL